MELIKFRKAIESDLITYLNWANDPMVRAQSDNSDIVTIKEHTNWFLEKLNDNLCYLYIFQNVLNENIGQVRIQKKDEFSAIIGLSIDLNFRGKGFGTKMLQLSAEEFFLSNPHAAIHAYVKTDNLSSKKIFEKAGYQMLEEIIYNNIKSFHFIKYGNRKF